MKKKFILLFVIVLLVIGYTHDQFLWCKKLLFSEPQTHTIQKGEYLSAIAKKYYGNPDYWKELALINRAPNSNLVFPGEEIIVPRLSVVKEIRRTRWMSKVNSFINDEKNILARLDKNEVEATYHAETIQDTVKNQTPVLATQEADFEPAVEEENEMKSASSLYIFGGIGILFVASLITFLIYRKKKQTEAFTFEDIDNSNGSAEDEDSEPDYQEYLHKKSKQKKEKVLAK